MIMKILITSDLFFVETNGVVTSVRNLMDELKKKGHDVRVLSIANKMKSYKNGDVTLIRSMPIKVYNGTRMPTSYRHKLIKELVEWKPDVIHSQCEFFSFRFARYISKKTGAPIVHTYHTMYEDYVGYVFLIKRFGRWVARKITKNFLESVDAVIVPTEKVKNRHIENGVRCEFNVVPSGINLEKHKERMSPEERKEMRKRFGITEDKIVLVNLGRIAPEKNVNELIDFFSKASVKNKNLVFLIVGDGPAMEQLQKQAHELGLSDCVVFTGMVAPTEVHKYYQLGDIFVSASTSETQGLTYIEAAANSLPLLCRYDECLQNVIVQGENGYAYTTEDEFLDRLNELLSSPERLEKASKRSEEIVQSFDKKVFADTVEKIYESVIETNKNKKGEV